MAIPIYRSYEAINSLHLHFYWCVQIFFYIGKEKLAVEYAYLFITRWDSKLDLSNMRLVSVLTVCTVNTVQQCVKNIVLGCFSSMIHVGN